MTVEESHYIGMLSPLPTSQEEWMARYVLRMVELGIDSEDAWVLCRSGASDHDYKSDPREAAENEMQMWNGDGDSQQAGGG